MRKAGYVYILTNTHKTVLYIGVTSNLSKRLYEHMQGEVPGFTKKYNVKTLVYYEEMTSIEEAIIREKSLKGKTRVKKDLIINSLNPEWTDLSNNYF